MKTIKILFAVVVVSTMFIACEADSVNDEVGLELEEVVSEDEGGDQVQPGNTI